MRVVLDGDDAAAQVSLREADDFQAFSVEVPDGFRLQAGAQVGPVRFSSAEQAWVDRRWLVGAGAFDEPDRREPFAAMVDFAERSGWIDAATGEIAAHVTTRPSTTHNSSANP